MQIEDELLERIQKHCESIEECNNTSPKTNLNVPLSTAEVRFLLSTIEGLKGEVERHQILKNYLLELRDVTPYGIIKEQITNVLIEAGLEVSHETP